MNVNKYNTIEDLATDINNSVRKIQRITFFPFELRRLICNNLWKLTDAEKALALGILKQGGEPVNGYRLFNNAKALGLNWSLSKTRIIRALVVYSWANGDTLVREDGSLVGKKEDVFLAANFDRIKQHNPLR